MPQGEGQPAAPVNGGPPPPVRYMKSHGIECKGVLICYIPFDSIVGDRNWTWQPIEMLGDIKTYKAILKSRSNKAP